MAHFNHAFGKSFYAKTLVKPTTLGVQNTSASLSTVGDWGCDRWCV